MNCFDQCCLTYPEAWLNLQRHAWLSRASLLSSSKLDLCIFRASLVPTFKLYMKQQSPKLFHPRLLKLLEGFPGTPVKNQKEGQDRKSVV